MWPILAQIGGIKITLFGLVLGLGFVIASFVVWRKMRDDYPEEEILSFTIALSLLTILAFLGWQWWSVGGVLLIPGLGLYLWTRRQKWNFWEWGDVIGPVSLGVASIGCFAWGPDYFLAGVALLGAWLMLTWLSRVYRRFSWYRSGKVGFIGIVSLIGWMTVWMVIAKWQKSAVYLGGLTLEQWIAGWVIIACVIAVYVRGERRITQDWKKITQIWPKIKNQ